MKQIRIKGSELIIISFIRRNGLGVGLEFDTKHLQDDVFTLLCLSKTEQTWIAHGFNSYVVKLKNPDEWGNPINVVN